MIKSFIKELGIEYFEEASLKRYNTYRIDLNCKYLIFPSSVLELVSLLQYLDKENIKHVVLGNGSNVIFACDYYDGVVILLNKLNHVSIEGDTVNVEAGYSLSKLALETVSLGLEGLEFAAGIPGFVGASIAMNAGAYCSSLSEVVEVVTVINPKYEVVKMRCDDLDFEYRSSIFKKEKKYIIVSAILKLTHGDKDELMERVTKRRVKRLETQPLDMPSAGSVFRNPDGMHAGELIEKCGLKGYSINGAMVSLKHANFIVNSGNASGKDILELIEKIKMEVKKQFDVDLILEQIIVD